MAIQESAQGGEKGSATGAQHLIVMDIDSTLINQEVIDLLGEEAGVGIAFCAKPKVQAAAPHHIGERNLMLAWDIIDGKRENA